MRTICAVTVALVLLVGLVPAADGRTAGRCAPEGAAILSADRSAQIYDAHFPNGTFAPNVYGCTLDHKYRRLLAHREGGCGFRGFLRNGVCGECRTPVEGKCGELIAEPLALAGTVVAYVEYRIEEGHQVQHLVVRSLRTDRAVHAFKVLAGTVVQLVVKADGAVAWVEVIGGRGFFYWGIGAVDRNGYRPLAELLHTEPRRLEVRGSVLAWEVDGRRATTPLH